VGRIGFHQQEGRGGRNLLDEVAVALQVMSDANDLGNAIGLAPKQ
jgi:hypothetical protein